MKIMLKCVILMATIKMNVFNVRMEVVANSAVATAFARSKIVPDVIPVAPDCIVNVVYPSGVTVYLGNYLFILQLQTKPTATYSHCIQCTKAKHYYLLVMIDPDVPSSSLPILGQFKHWIVGNIPCDDVAAGQTLTLYLGPTPPPVTGKHRYVFLVFKQPGKLTFDVTLLNATSLVDRTNFCIVEFAKKYKLGIPIAGNYFLARFLALPTS